jgi:hypothetical protein
MNKENLILVLLCCILLLLGYNTIILTRLSSAGSVESEVKLNTEKQEDVKADQEVNPYANANLKTEILPNKDGTFGYRILLNGSPMIAQPNIPGLPGNAGFSDAPKAQRTADLILHKIRNNIMPPSVTVEELDSLGVL